MVNPYVADYISLREKLDGITIDGLDQYNISSAIAIQEWKAVTMTTKAVFLRTIGLLINEKLLIKEAEESKYKRTALLYVEPVPIRTDNEQIFNNGVSFIEPCNHVRFELNSKKSIKWLIKKMPVFFRALKKLTGFPLVQKLYFAASISVIYEVDYKCRQSRAMQNTRELLVFQDHEMMQNIAVQFVRNQGGIAVSLQHGQRVYRKLDADYMAFDNFISNYTLLWNTFSQAQYLKAGYDIARLPVVGCTKYARKGIEYSMNSNPIRLDEIIIGVILNAPAQFRFNEITKNLLQWTARVTEELNCKAIIKIHPTDKNENYTKYISDRISIAEAGMSMQKFSEKITCGIGHASGALVDLIITNVPVFLYNNDISFPLELPNEYKFSGYMELKKCLTETTSELRKNPEMFSEIRKIYYEDDAIKLHEQFFDQIGRNI